MKSLLAQKKLIEPRNRSSWKDHISLEIYRNKKKLHFSQNILNYII